MDIVPTLVANTAHPAIEYYLQRSRGEWPPQHQLDEVQRLPMCLVLVGDKHDDVIKWKHFPRYWPFVRGIHRSQVNSPHKGQWRGALMFSLICISFAKLQRLHHWRMGVNDYFHPTLWYGYNYLSVLGLKLNHASEKAPSCWRIHTIYLPIVHMIVLPYKTKDSILCTQKILETTIKTNTSVRCRYSN